MTIQPWEKSSSLKWPIIVIGVLAISFGAFIGMIVGYSPNVYLPIAAAVGFIVAILTLANLEFGLLAFVFMTYIRLYNIIELHGGPSLQLPFMAFLVLLILIHWVIERHFPEISIKLVVLFSMFGVSTFLSYLYAGNMVDAQDALETFIKGGSVAVIVGLIFTKKEYMRGIVWTLVLVGGILGSVSVFQYLTSSFTNDFWGFGTAVVENIVGGTNDYRLSGSLGDPNLFAMVMVVLVPLALERAFTEKKKILKILAIYALIVIVMTIVFTFSRGGFLSLLVVIGFLVLWKKPPLTYLLIGLVLFILSFSILPPSYTQRMATLTDVFSQDTTEMRNEVSFRGRFSEAGVAWIMFRDHPIIGVGPGNYNSEYMNYSRQLGWDPRVEARGAHNLYLEVASEQGIVGLTIFLFILYSVFAGLVRSSRKFKKLNQPGLADMSIALMIGFAGYCTASIFLHNIFPYYLWMLIGIAFSLEKIADNEIKNPQIGITTPVIDGSLNE